MFDNELPEATNFDGIRNTGLRPGDIGLDIRKITRKGEMTAIPSVKTCRNQETNCFSTLVDKMVPGKKLTWLLEPWRLPEGMSTEDGLRGLIAVVKAYPPGQGDVDAGGFRIVEVTKNYLYAQFASVSGLIDDTEFAIEPTGQVQIRSASRSMSDAVVGFMTEPDKGSNMQRLNYISAELRQQGWTAPEITRDKYEYYFKVNKP